MKKILVLGLMLIAYNANSQSLTQSNFEGIVVPKIMASGTNDRIPMIYYAKVSGLSPNTTYRYFNQIARSVDFGGNNPGAGNPFLFYGYTDFLYTSSPSLTTAERHGLFTTDANGEFTGWFGITHTGNARFTPGDYLYPSIVLGDDGTGSVVARYALNDSILVTAFSTNSGSPNSTAIYGISSANQKNVVALWDNLDAIGRPLAVTFVENANINGDPSSYTTLSSYYADSVLGRDGRWGTVIPNDNSNGVRLITVHAWSNAATLNSSSAPTGVWPSGANTVNPTGGTQNPIRITMQDAPLVIRQDDIIAEKFSMSQNYPNPFNPETTIRFEIPVNGFVTLKIYNMLGQEVSSLVNGSLNSGSYLVIFNASGLNSGVYFYTMKFDNGNGILFSETKKLTLIK